MGAGAGPVSTARLQFEPRSRGASPRVPDLGPSAEVGWFFCLREAEQNPPSLRRRTRWRGEGLWTPSAEVSSPFAGLVPFCPRKGN